MTAPVSHDFHADVESVLAYIIQEFMNYMKQMGLSMPQIHTLMYIYHSGGCQVSDLSALAEVSNAAASQLVERLVQHGLVERREDPANRRSKILTLSGQGRELIRNSVLSNHYLNGTMASLSAEERQIIQQAFTIMARSIEQFHQIQPKKGI